MLRNLFLGLFGCLVSGAASAQFNIPPIRTLPGSAVLTRKNMRAPIADLGFASPWSVSEDNVSFPVRQNQFIQPAAWITINAQQYKNYAVDCQVTPGLKYLVGIDNASEIINTAPNGHIILVYTAPKTAKAPITLSSTESPWNFVSCTVGLYNN